MRKNFLKHAKCVIVLLIAAGFYSCNEQVVEQPERTIRDKFLVDRIYDYHHNLLAEYIYDDNNRLIKRIFTNKSVSYFRTDEMRIETEFKYNRGRVSKMISNVWQHTVFHTFAHEVHHNYREEITFEYDSQGRLIGNSWGARYRYENGRVVGFLSNEADGFIRSDTLVYNHLGNIIQHILTVPELTNFGQPIPGTSQRVVHYFEFDNNPRPNFGIDHLFSFQPLPYTSTADLQMTLSRNNMTRSSHAGTSWVYTYNEHGLPATIETIWEGIPTETPMLLRIVYREIE